MLSVVKFQAGEFFLNTIFVSGDVKVTFSHPRKQCNPQYCLAKNEDKKRQWLAFLIATKYKNELEGQKSKFEKIGHQIQWDIGNYC